MKKSGCNGLIMGDGRERLGSGRLGISLLKSLSVCVSAIVGCEKLQKPFSSVSQVSSIRSWASRPPVVDPSWCRAFHLGGIVVVT